MSFLGKSRELIVNVLCPNGRRVKVKSNSSVCAGQVIEEACLKHNYDPLDYNIRHLKRILDPGSSLQYSNVPNHAQLELVAAEIRRKVGLITVHILAEQGLKFVKEFPSNTTLWDILCHHEQDNNHEWTLPKSSDDESFIVYTMRKIVGDELKTVTLKSLGLFTGQCMMRYHVQRKKAATEVASEVAPAQTNSGSRSVSEVAPAQTNSGSRSVFRGSDAVKPQENAVTVKSPVGKVDQVSQNESSINTTVKVDSEMCDSDSISKPTIKNEIEVGDSETKPDMIPVDGAEMQRSLEDDKMDSMNSETKLHHDNNRDEGGRRDDHSSKELMEVDEKELLPSKMHTIDNDQEESESLLDDPVSSTSDQCSTTVEDKIIPLSDHESILFSLDDAPPTNLVAEDDGVFELTLNEVRNLHVQQMKIIKEFDDAPLQTKQMRELEKDTQLLSALNRFPITQIRVCFPDRFVVQANFKPQSTVREVVDFLRPLLVDPNMDFYLYLDFPRTILSLDTCLADAGCVPKARLNFGSELIADTFLSPETLSKKSTFTGAASKVVQVHRRQNTHGQATSGRLSSTSKNKSTESVESKAKVPKWFKLGK